MSSTPSNVDRTTPTSAGEERRANDDDQQRLSHGVRTDSGLGSTQPVEPLEDITGLEGTEFAPGT